MAIGSVWMLLKRNADAAACTDCARAVKNVRIYLPLRTPMSTGGGGGLEVLEAQEARVNRTATRARAVNFMDSGWI
jgi:hypothetical protein